MRTASIDSVKNATDLIKAFLNDFLIHDINLKSPL